MKHDNLAAGGPAFPVADPFATHQPGHEDEARRLMSGMTLRDYFAAQAIQGATTGNGGLPDSNYCQLIAKRAYDLADAMIAAREGAKADGGAA